MKTLDALAQERNKEFLGEPARFYNIETDLFGGTGQLGEKTATMASDLLDCYTTPRGAHPNGTGVFTFSSIGPMMNFFPFA